LNRQVFSATTSNLMCANPVPNWFKLGAFWCL
jgi:hypothetical protein